MRVTQRGIGAGFLALAVASLIHPLAGPLLLILALLAGSPAAVLACVLYLLSGQLGGPASLLLLAWMLTRITAWCRGRATVTDARCPTCNWMSRPCPCGQQASLLMRTGDNRAPWKALHCSLAFAVAWLAGPVPAAWALSALWFLASLDSQKEVDSR
ncbi:MAG: hypothetical protein HY319_16910 [Armatimonadetes bacterium]|nr:hypothetical protein [Armatimonadota bacterium]